MTPSPVLDFKFTAPPESPAQTFLPGRPAGVLGRSFTPQRNPRLQGLQCLRCDALYPVTLPNDGCLASPPAGFPAPGTFTYQGIVVDPAAPNGRAAVTNAVELIVR